MGNTQTVYVVFYCCLSMGNTDCCLISYSGVSLDLLDFKLAYLMCYLVLKLSILFVRTPFLTSSLALRSSLIFYHRPFQTDHLSPYLLGDTSII